MYFLILTAFTVSIDSFACGFSLAKGKNNIFILVSAITLTVLFMCLIANYFALFALSFLTDKTVSLGGILLIAVGIYDLVKKEEEPLLTPARKIELKTVLSVGFAVGLDGALANLSLSLMGLNAVYVPVIIALMHGVMIELGAIVSELVKKTKIFNVGLLSSLVLIALGFYKVIEFFS